jgi:hypothetical protein
MAKKNWIFIKRGLSEDPKHRQAMGDAVWLFMHICDAADWEKGIVYDWRDKEIAVDMSLCPRTVRDWRQRLQKSGYIRCEQHQHSLDIVIHNWTNPRDYGGKKMNLLQGDVKVSPSKSQGDTQGTPQGDTQGDTQGLHESTGEPASFIESSSSSSSLSEEDKSQKQKLLTDLRNAGHCIFGNNFTAWREIEVQLEAPGIQFEREDGTFKVTGLGMKAAMYQDRYALSFARALAGIYNQPTEVVFMD